MQLLCLSFIKKADPTSLARVILAQLLSFQLIQHFTLGTGSRNLLQCMGACMYMVGLFIFSLYLQMALLLAILEICPFCKNNLLCTRSKAGLLLGKRTCGPCDGTLRSLPGQEQMGSLPNNHYPAQQVTLKSYLCYSFPHLPTSNPQSLHLQERMLMFHTAPNKWATRVTSRELWGKFNFFHYVNRLPDWRSGTCLASISHPLNLDRQVCYQMGKIAVLLHGIPRKNR